MEKFRIKDARKAAGFSTQDQLADVLNVKRAAVSKLETGATYPKPTVLPLLAAKLNSSADEIIAAITAARNAV